MKLETRYGLGDRVWVVEETTTHIRQACPACGGTSKLVALDGSQQHCYRCSAGQVVVDEVVRRWPVPCTVGLVRVEVRSGQAPDEVYMLEETGIGSGRLWDVGKLYPTQEACEAACHATPVTAETE